MPLNLPNGARSFVDANILVYALVNSPFTSQVSLFMQRVAAKEVTAFTTSIVLSEALHRIMLAEVLAQFQPTVKPLAYVQRHPNVISQLTIYPIAVDRLLQLGISLLPVDGNSWKAATVVASTHQLLTNDACIAATMAIHNVRDLVTNDDDFDHVPGLNVWKPR